MPDINRSLIIVQAKQPFLDWAHAIDPEDDSRLEDINEDPTAYLVPEFETEPGRDELIEWCADFVFEYELWLWCPDDILWPEVRDAATFLKWFEVEFHSMVVDIVADIPLKHVDYNEDEDDLDVSSNGH